MRERQTFMRTALLPLMLIGTTHCGDLEFLVTLGEGGAPDGGGGSGLTPTVGGGGEGAGFETGGGGAGGVGGEGGMGGGPPEPYCGDSIVQPGEGCDDGNIESGDGCTNVCVVESGWACLVPGEPCILTVVCGDGEVFGTETCDDGNLDSGDGCGADCVLEDGWICPVPDTECEAALCGDGILAGDEACEDDDIIPMSGDGCSADCRLEPGYKCDEIGAPCVETVCGDGVREGTEQCDDGNNDFGDLCTPLFCTYEPDCSNSPAESCTTSCGDGIMLPGGTEACEDGNTQDGDGCSAACEIEVGYNCVQQLDADVNSLVLPVVYRDFLASHPDMEDFLGTDRGIVEDLLGADQKPVYANPGGTTPTTSGANAFNQWYRDFPGTNLTLLDTLTLNRIGQNEFARFTFSDPTFFPLTGRGFNDQLMSSGGTLENFYFTSEVRYWFEYKGGEFLDFTGDDDVFVFVNKHLAMDLGGVHPPEQNGVILADRADEFELTLGEVYEIGIYQAERHGTASSYQLTIGFFNNGRSECSSICGDGFRTPDEQCDEGAQNNDNTYGGCGTDCRRGPRCGDGVLQPQFEECDDGMNITPYGGCAPGCVEGAFCGDGNVDSLFGEQCDDGVNDGGYMECAPGCVVGERCGDGIEQGIEECDDGNSDDGDACGNDCKNNIIK